MNEVRLDVEAVGVRYGRTTALDRVSFRIGAGELVGVLGPNGAGKSSLFKAVAGLVPHTGSVTVNGISCHHRVRTDIAFIPQRSSVDPQFPIRVGELVASGRRPMRRWFQRPSRHDRLASNDAIDRVGLTGLDRRPIGELSGGQLQRAFLARALNQGAEVMLFDEALSGVDAPSTAQLFDLFEAVAGTGVTLLVSTHDLALARRRFRRCLALHRTLVADGPPEITLAAEMLDVVFGSATPVPSVTMAATWTG